MDVNLFALMYTAKSGRCSRLVWGVKGVSGEGCHITVFGVLHLPYPLLGTCSASDLRSIGTALVSIVSITRMMSDPVVNYS